MARISRQVRIGLLLLSGHVRAILDDKEHEFELARESGDSTEYTAEDLEAMQAAYVFMVQEGEVS